MQLGNALKSNKRILYFTDKTGVTDGYKRAFNLMLLNAGINHKQVSITSIYNLVADPLIKKGNRKAPGFNPDRTREITEAFALRVESLKPDIIVVSCPAVLGLLTDWDWSLATLDKCRGGVYDYQGIPVVVTIPITAIHQQVDEKVLKDMEGDPIQSEPYRVKQGGWILQRDWEKVGRFVHDKTFKIPDFLYSVCRTIPDCVAAKKWLADCVLVSTDIETGCYPAMMTCIGFTGLKANGACRSFVIPYFDPTNPSSPGDFWESIDDQATAWSIMQDILDSDVPKTMQNGFYDASYFIKYRAPIRNWFLDSMFMWYSLYMELPKTLDFIASILMDNYRYWKDDIKGIDNAEVDGNAGMEQYWRYCALDCYTTLWNTVRLVPVISASQLGQKNYRDTFMRVLSGLQMSMRGVKADFKRREEIREGLEQEAAQAIKQFRFIIDDPEFNINSPDQKNKLLYDVLGARERTAKGRYVNPDSKKPDDRKRASGKIALKMIRTEHPFFGYIVDHLEKAMEPDKQISNVCGIKLFTDRFRTAFNGTGTTTTRFSSKSSNFWDGGNAQNIREVYRDWLVADEGCLLMDVDYSQSDDIFVGYESNDPDKIRVIESGMDGHAVHGELFFKVPYDEIVSGKKAGDPRIVHPITGIRQIAKRVVHGTNFQMAAITLFMTMGRESVVGAAKLLGFDDADSYSQDRLVNVCGYLMAAYRKKYKRLNKKEWYAEIAKDLKTKGTIVNAFGIERRFLGDPEDNGTQREATGFIGQSDTAGNMNRAMYEVDWGFIPERFRDGLNPDFRDRPRQMTQASHGFQFLLQIHDSFVCQLDTRHPNWKEGAANLLHVMERPIIINGHSVRVKTEAEVGTRWSKRLMSGWKGTDPHDLDRIAVTHLTGKELVA